MGSQRVGHDLATEQQQMRTGVVRKNSTGKPRTNSFHESGARDLEDMNKSISWHRPGTTLSMEQVEYTVPTIHADIFCNQALDL